MGTKAPTKTAISKALKQLNKSTGTSLEKDARSALTRMMLAVMIKSASATAAKRALGEIQERFADWNEVRISDKRDLIITLLDAGFKHPQRATDEMQEILADIFEQYNVVNFAYEDLDRELYVIPVVEEGEQIDLPTIREEGLPKHPEVPGFLDESRLLTETSRLEGKLIDDKNGDAIFMSVYDNPAHSTAKIVWAVALSLKLLPEGLNELEALPLLRKTMGTDQLNFARLAMTYYENNNRSVDKHFAGQEAVPVSEEEAIPFSVRIGFASADSVQETTEPIMPRSEGIGRLSKRATPKLAPTKSSGRRATASSGSAKKTTRKKTTKKAASKKKTTKKAATKKATKKSSTKKTPAATKKKRATTSGRKKKTSKKS